MVESIGSSCEHAVLHVNPDDHCPLVGSRMLNGRDCHRTCSDNATAPRRARLSVVRGGSATGDHVPDLLATPSILENPSSHA